MPMVADNADKTLYKQVVLTQQNSTRICWLPSEGLKKGIVCKLKGDEESGWWRVECISNIQLAKYLLHTDWDVGGIESSRE